MGRSKKLMLVALVVGAIMLMTESTAWAAQGQITEVNPSGIGHMSQRAVDALSGLFAGFSDYVEFIRNSFSFGFGNKSYCQKWCLGD